MTGIRVEKRSVRRRSPRSNLGALLAITFSARAFGAPTGGVVRSGTASIDQAGSVTTVTQASNKASIDWQSFSVGKQETVTFDQPSASAVTLNRVVGSEGSVIEGALNANGQVFLINANGVLFAKGSQVNAAGLVASTLELSEADFRAGNYAFKGKSQGSVKNRGTLNAEDHGYVALLGANVTNQGVIAATRGTVALASGEKVTLNFRGYALFSVTIDQGTLNALVENKQAIMADGGKVFLTARAADELLGAQVNNTGVIQARTLGDLTGTIDLHAYGGTAHVDGTLDASAPNGGSGGFIETSGDTVHVADSAGISTFAPRGQSGTWLIDPNGYTIAESGGDMSGTMLSNSLKTGNVEIQASKAEGSDGNIYVNDEVKWSTDNKLTLTATNDIYVNRSITAEGNGELVLNLGATGDYHIRTLASFSGAVLDAKGKPVANQAPDGTGFAEITLKGENAKLTINDTQYTLIHSVDQLMGLLDDGKASGNFALAGDLDFASWSAENTTKVGSVIKTLTGTLSGLGHEVMNLTLAAGSVSPNLAVGFIGTAAKGSTVRDIGVTNANIAVNNNPAGILLGKGENGVRVSHAYSTGSVSVSLNNLAGGLIGRVGNDAVITDSFSLASVGGATDVGGLIGLAGAGTRVERAHATGNVTGTVSAESVGGLIGEFSGAAITNCYATGRVTNLSGTGTVQELAEAGGLVGALRGARSGTLTLTNSFARGDVVGEWVASAGGLVGATSGVEATVTLSNSYALGDVTASPRLNGDEVGIGGLVGRLTTSNNRIQDSYATGDVTVRAKGRSDASGIGVARVGGLIGYAGSYTARGGTGGPLTMVVSETSLEVENSYATGKVSAPDYGMVGGLLGKGIGTILIDGSYATGDVTGRNRVGGLVGALGVLGWTGTVPPGQSPPEDFDHATHTIQNSWSAGKATATEASPEVGGLVGAGSATLSNSYWDSDKNPAYGGDSVPTSNSVHGLHTNQILDAPYYIDGTIEQVLAERAARDADTQKRIEEAEARAREAEEALERLQDELDDAQSALSDALAEKAKVSAEADKYRAQMDAFVAALKQQLEESKGKLGEALDEANRALGVTYDIQAKLEQTENEGKKAAQEKADAESLINEVLLAVQDATDAAARAKADAEKQIAEVRADAQKQIDAARAEAQAARAEVKQEDSLATLSADERARILEAAWMGAVRVGEIAREIRGRERSARTYRKLPPLPLEIRWSRREP